jgi:hypothetical protein
MSFLVPVTGVEPVRYRYHWILSFRACKETTGTGGIQPEPTTLKKASKIKGFRCSSAKKSDDYSVSILPPISKKKITLEGYWRDTSAQDCNSFTSANVSNITNHCIAIPRR